MFALNTEMTSLADKYSDTWWPIILFSIQLTTDLLPTYFFANFYKPSSKRIADTKISFLITEHDGDIVDILEEEEDEEETAGYSLAKVDREEKCDIMENLLLQQKSTAEDLRVSRT